MPVISTRYSTTGSSYISPSTTTLGTYRSTALDRPSYASATESYLNRSRSTYRSSISSSTGLGLSGISSSRDSTPSSYRHSSYFGTTNGNDSVLGSASNRYTSSNSSSVSSFKKADQLPPTGQLAPRYLNRSESRIRGADNQCNSQCLSSTPTGDLCNHTHTHTPTRSSSLARALATCGADLYDKYSPANFQQPLKAELTRSRSLTDNTETKDKFRSAGGGDISLNNNKVQDKSVKVNVKSVAAQKTSSTNHQNCDNNNKTRLLTARKPPQNNCSNPHHTSTATTKPTASSTNPNQHHNSHHHHHTHHQQQKNVQLTNALNSHYSRHLHSNNNNDNLTNNNINSNNSTKQEQATLQPYSSPIVAAKTKSINSLIDTLNQKLQSLEKTVVEKKQAKPATNVELNGGGGGDSESSARSSPGLRNGFGGTNNNNVIMPSQTTSNGGTNFTLSQGKFFFCFISFILTFSRSRFFTSFGVPRQISAM